MLVCANSITLALYSCASEAAWRHDHIHEVREIFVDSLRALSAFVAAHWNKIAKAARSFPQAPPAVSHRPLMLAWPVLLHFLHVGQDYFRGSRRRDGGHLAGCYLVYVC